MKRQLRCYFCDKTFTVERNWKVFYCPYCTKVNALPDILKDKSIKYLVPEKKTVYMDTVYNIPKVSSLMISAYIISMSTL